jgi:hypothetical protein
VALDPGWAAIGGAAVGSLGTVGIGLLERIGRRHVEDREDHVRDLDRRRELYAECIELEREYHQIAADVSFALQLGEDVEQGDRDGLLSVHGRFTALAARIDLLAPASVRKAYEALFRESSMLTVAIDTVASRFGAILPTTADGGLAQRLRQLEEPGAGGLEFLAEFNRLAEAMIDAMRADLRIREPKGAPRSIRFRRSRVRSAPVPARLPRV